jgi:hypothetical protein
LSFERYLVGVSAYGDNGEFRSFIFSDGSKSEFETTSDASNFKDTFIKPANAIVKTVVLKYVKNASYKHDERSIVSPVKVSRVYSEATEEAVHEVGKLAHIERAVVGIIFYDDKETIIMEAGNLDGVYSTHRIELNEGERIVGIKSERGGFDLAQHFDLQLVLGSLVWK